MPPARRRPSPCHAGLPNRRAISRPDAARRSGDDGALGRESCTRRRTIAFPALAPREQRPICRSTVEPVEDVSGIRQPSGFDPPRHLGDRLLRAAEVVDDEEALHPRPADDQLHVVVRTRSGCSLLYARWRRTTRPGPRIARWSRAASRMRRRRCRSRRSCLRGRARRARDDVLGAVVDGRRRSPARRRARRTSRGCRRCRPPGSPRSWRSGRRSTRSRRPRRTRRRSRRSGATDIEHAEVRR